MLIVYYHATCVHRLALLYMINQVSYLVPKSQRETKWPLAVAVFGTITKNGYQKIIRAHRKLFLTLLCGLITKKVKPKSNTKNM